MTRLRKPGAQTLGRSALVFIVVSAAACSSGTGKTATPTSASSSAPAATSTTVDAASVAANPSTGCKAPVIKTGQTRVDTTSNGAPRWYLRNVPAAYNGRTPLPVIVDLHGYAEGATVHTQMSALGPYGDLLGFITITPEGSGTSVPMWNTDLKGADIAFIGNLLNEIDRTLCVDDRRVYVSGLSNGAFMTSAVACAYSNRVAAVAPVAGIRDIKGCAPTRAVPVVTFHGTADPYVSYTGGLGAKALDLPAANGSHKTLGQEGLAKTALSKGPSVPQITATWAKRNGCSTRAPSEQKLATDVTLLTWDCPHDASVELYRITGGGHAWPGSAFSRAIASAVGKTTFSISADQIIWKFFLAHPLTR
jgi:polyhydroxybutyrate depolymerase